MKKKLSKSEVLKQIDDFFKKETFTSDELRKLRRLAMKHKIPLKHYRKHFCKSCLSQLKGKIRVTKTHKRVICNVCSYKNRWKIGR